MNNLVHHLQYPTLPIKNSQAVFPLARVFGIGRNYSESPDTEVKEESKMLLFMKDPYMVSLAETGVAYPSGTHKLRYEIELVIAIGKGGTNIPVNKAEECIYGYAVGIDFTKYDVQDLAKQLGWPWDKGKSFPGCAPCTEITPKNEFMLENNPIWLKKNGKLAQEGTLNQMIWTVPEIISSISSQFQLIAGDLIFTGTPNGVGMTEKGDLLEGEIEGLNKINIKIT